jgi:hypothetical protein
MTQIWTEDDRLPGVEIAANFYRLTYSENKKAKIQHVIHSRERPSVTLIKKRHIFNK